MTQQTISNILVFQTKVANSTEFNRLAEILDTSPEVQKWTLDQQDVDKVLRVISEELQPQDIVYLLNKNGLYCQELPD
jgi:cell fate (sporulation/competence/biofilm development) regulator YmcA (YheA/YmcA/DUF963 family)